MAEKPTPQKPPGPEPEHLKLEGNWEDRIKEALQKPRPKEGWPKHDEPEPKK